jgi:hypothetical protein
MNPVSLFSEDRPASASPGSFGIAAFATFQACWNEIGPLRRGLALPGKEPYPANFLKSSDEQTVVALAAVLQAIREFGLESADFRNWGVLAAPRFLGRVPTAEILHKCERGGSGKASPVFVPHHSLHAVSGTVSMALAIQGPNYGVSGGTNFVVEGFLSILSFLSLNPVDGLWAVLSQLDPEPDPEGNDLESVTAQALALAFVPVANDWQGLRLHLIDPDRSGQTTVRSQAEAERVAVFSSLCNFFNQTAAATGSWSCSLSWGSRLELTHQPVAVLSEAVA